MNEATAIEAQPTARELLEAEVERRRKVAAARPVLTGVSCATDSTNEVLAILSRARHRTIAAFERFAADMEVQNENPCERHPGIVLALDREQTVRDSLDADRFTPVFKTCELCAADARHARRWSRAGVPDRVLLATLDNYETPNVNTAEALSLARLFAMRATRRGGFLLLLGTTGTGKGHLAVGAAKSIAPHGDFVFLTHADLLTRLRASYGRGETETFLEQLKTARVLILDEFGVSVGGKDEAPVLYQILSTRHDKRLPTILTSNEETSVVREVLGFRLLDRIREEQTLINLTGESWRTRSAAQEEGAK